MDRVAHYREALGELTPEERTSFLRAQSGLPGPRANLPLMQAAADVGDLAWFEHLAASAEEYLAATGAVGLGRVLAEANQDAPLAARTVEQVRRLAADDRWRVREGAAMALQRLGDSDPVRLWSLARQWAADRDPLVQRAAAAGICEPRLLRSPQAAAVALEVCHLATELLAARSPDDRRSPRARTLRQALGYCWSVAVAADPDAGLPAFRDLAEDRHPDVVWIVRQNRRKARLARLLPTEQVGPGSATVDPVRGEGP